jgi:phosphopantetheinyl transferase
VPLFALKNLANQSFLGIWKVEESIEELQSKLILNQKEYDFFRSLGKGKRNLHWLAGRVMLRQLLKTSEFIEIFEDSFGKPYLQNFDFELSITHSYDFAGVIISKSKVGIDIEKMKKDLTFLAPKFMSANEIGALNQDHRFKQYYVYWCVKESIYKLYGKKELSFKNNIIVEAFNYKPVGQLTAEIIKENYQTKYLVNYEEFFPGYMLSYVIENKNK